MWIGLNAFDVESYGLNLKAAQPNADRGEKVYASFPSTFSVSVELQE